jgi:two-component system, NarL family, nitrate/nitrite response regulator NarL
VQVGSPRPLPDVTDRGPARAPKIRLLIISEIRLYRAALAQFLGCHEDVRVVGSASDFESGMRSIRCSSPDVILIDVATGSGIPCIHDLSRARSDLKVVALGIAEVGDDVVACAEAGAAGYILRGASPEEAIRAVKSAAKGEAVLSPRTAAALLTRVRALAAGRPTEQETAALTTREVDVLALIGKGLANKEIAAALSIEVSTVKNHVHSILQKLHLHRRSEAKAWLRDRSGLRE